MIIIAIKPKIKRAADYLFTVRVSCWTRDQGKLTRVVEEHYNNKPTWLWYGGGTGIELVSRRCHGADKACPTKSTDHQLEVWTPNSHQVEINCVHWIYFFHPVLSIRILSVYLIKSLKAKQIENWAADFKIGNVAVGRYQGKLLKNTI